MINDSSDQLSSGFDDSGDFATGLVIPGYGILPNVTISVRRIPKDHTSDLMLKVPKLMASGAVHLMGNLAPV